MSQSKPDANNFVIEDNQLLEVKIREDEIIIPEGVTHIADHCFRWFVSLESVVLPNSLTVIGNYAFEHCRYLTSVTMGQSVKKIGAGAFTNCYSLKSIHLPDSVEEIGAYAFSKCSSLKTVTIPKSVQDIQRRFFACYSLEDISFPFFPSLETTHQSKILTLKLKKWEALCPEEQEILLLSIQGKPTLRKILLFSDSIPPIQMFLERNKKLKLDELDSYLKHAISKKRTEITAILLEYQRKQYTEKELEDYLAHNELLEIGFELPTFTEFRKKWRCSKKDGGISITGYKGSEEKETIPFAIKDGTPIRRLRLDDTSFLELHIDANLDEESYIASDSKLHRVSFSSTLTSIPSIQYCHVLESVEIPDSVTALYHFAFLGCSSLKSIKIPDSVISIGVQAFQDCSALTTITIPKLVTKIPPHCFTLCLSLVSVHMSHAVKVLGECAFHGCSVLESMDISDGLQDIGDSCFRGCRSLKSLSLPNSLTFIGPGAFFSCDALESLNIPDSVTEIGEQAFFYCYKLVDESGFLIIKNHLHLYGGTEPSVQIPDGVTKILPYAFHKWESLESVALPDSLTEIGDYAFSTCNQLVSVTMGDSVALIGNHAFQQCTALKSVVLSQAITEIEHNTFDSTGLESIIIPDSVKIIHSYAFSDCLLLHSVMIPNSVTAIDSFTFANCTSLRTLQIPDSVINLERCTFYNTRVSLQGNSGSYAESYAKKYNFSFEVIP